MNSKSAMRWVTALKPEAQPIIDALGLRRFAKCKKYPIYTDKSEENWLIISGVGQTNVVKAVEYLYQESDAPPWSGWINLGIAGSGLDDYGRMYLVDKISSEIAANSLFPGVAISSDLPRSGLFTVRKPRTDYEGQELIDMEGYCFYKSVNRFCCRELIVVLKVVSDGSNANIKALNSRKIKELILGNLEKVLVTASHLSELSNFEAKRLTAPDEYEIVLAKWHFTVSQEYQLKNLIYRWHSCFPDKLLISHISHCKNAQSVLKHLSEEVDPIEIDWGKV